MKNFLHFLKITAIIIGLAIFAVAWVLSWPAMQAKKMWDAIPITPTPDDKETFNRMNQP